MFLKKHGQTIQRPKETWTGNTTTNLYNWKDATYYKYGDAKVNLKGRGNLGVE
jgi:hypothetical protein